MEDKNKINEENEFYLSELAQWERPFIELDRFFEANKRIDITMDQFEESVRLKDVYDKLFRYMFCGVCGRRLSKKETLSISPEDFHYTCENHRHLSTVFNLDVINKEREQ